MVLVWVISKLLERPWHVRFQHILREPNQVTDSLAKAGVNAPPPVQVVVVIPGFLRDLIDRDRDGAPYNRATAVMV